MSRLNNLYRKMIEFYRDDPARIQHFIKVHSFAKLIGEEEHLDEKLLYILEAAAYVHDIGIRPAEAKFGRCDGKLQEQEGPAEAEKMLKSLGFEQDVIERVSYLVGHHHTTDIDGVINNISAATRLTWMLTDQGTCRRERIVFTDQINCSGVILFTN